MIEAERGEGRPVGNRKDPLQIIQRSEGDELTGSVRCAARYGRARENEAWSNCAGKNRADRRTQAAIVWRQQRVAAGQRGSAAAGSKETVSARSANAGRRTGCDQVVDERRLRRRDVSERARNRIETRNHRYRGRAGQPLRHVARKKA